MPMIRHVYPMETFTLHNLSTSVCVHLFHFMHPKCQMTGKINVILIYKQNHHSTSSLPILATHLSRNNGIAVLDITDTERITDMRYLHIGNNILSYLSQLVAEVVYFSTNNYPVILSSSCKHLQMLKFTTLLQLLKAQLK